MKLPWTGLDCLNRLTDPDYLGRYSTVLDVGAGEGKHAALFREAGKVVTELEPKGPPRPPERMKMSLQHFEEEWHHTTQWDLVWACHVLEHQRNVGEFIGLMVQHCRPGGLLAVTVPPRKDAIVGGHLTLWNAGLLLYNLVMAGIDCRDARVRTNGYNCSVIVEARFEFLPPGLEHDHGDIERLANRFPPACRVQGFNGWIPELNWR